MIQLWRAALDDVAPRVLLITETNVPHSDNVSYFGNGANEAQLVYNFALPPLVLHALLRGDATHLTRWAQSLTLPGDQVTFFNFLASHDGIGLNPARGILPESEIAFLVERCQAQGGFINYKHNADGSKSPYEMNVVYFDAVNDPATRESRETQVDRFLVAHAIMLALRGLPALYFHSLFGSRNDREAALATGINRRINRQRFDRATLESELADSRSLRATVFGRLKTLLQSRRASAAFHPAGAQHVLDGDPRVFAVMRTAADGAERVLCLHNVSNRIVSVSLEIDAATDRAPLKVTLRPYEVNWLPLPSRQMPHSPPASHV